jgi:serine/threonine-protein kinase HipA
MQTFMKKLHVHYCGWGEDWPLGVLADDGVSLLFEYSPEALVRKFEPSPVHLKLRSSAYGGFPEFLFGLPGFIADCLPDGWGLMLMDRIFRQQGLQSPSPLDRLAFVGNRAMGALRFAPAAEDESPPDWSLLTLAVETQRVLSDEASAVLRELAFTGGSPQGARPKALVQYDKQNVRISTSGDASGTPWLVKFQAQGEHKEVCAIEYMYAALARDCGLEMPDAAYFDLSPTLAAFAVSRFDRADGMRVPVHSLSGLLHVNYRLPGCTDYTALLRATRLLTRDAREVEKAYARAVFNVIFHNRDDHPKNFAWRWEEDRRWRLAPAFDLTFSDGPGNQHHMDVCGEGNLVGRQHLLRLANEGGVPSRAALGIIARIAGEAQRIRQRMQDYPIRRATAQRIAAAVENCCLGTA